MSNLRTKRLSDNFLFCLVKPDWYMLQSLKERLSESASPRASLPLEDPLEEAKRVLAEARRSKIVLKLIGGVAVYLRCPSAKRPNLARRYIDIDLVGLSKQSPAIKKLFVQMGYAARDRFNAMYGDRRLIFNDQENQRRVDVFLDIFEMCHTLNLKERLLIEGSTIPPADILATKLQIVQIDPKDYKDLVAILLDHEVGSSDDGMINGKYLAKVCSADWGIYKTIMMNLGRLAGLMSDFQLGEDDGRMVEARIKNLGKMIEDEPKSLKWRMRARIGERVVWYRLPEADKEVVDSRMPGSEPVKHG